MTRVSSFGQSQMLLQSLVANQRAVFEDQQAITTGKKAQDYSGLAGDVASLLSAKTVRTRTEGYIDLIRMAEGRVDTNDVQVDAMLQTARDLRQTVITTLADGQATSFRDIMEEAFSFITSSLNTEMAGQFIFSGSKTDIPPVTAQTLDDLIAAANAGDIFQNDSRVAVVRASANVDVEVGLLADDIALDFMASLKRLADFDADPMTGPLDGPLTDAQRTFLSSELPLLDAAIDKMQSEQTRNGLRFGRFETLVNQHEDSLLFLEEFISNIEDTNIAEAITKLNSDQMALEASMRTIGTLTRSSLLDFI